MFRISTGVYIKKIYIYLSHTTIRVRLWLRTFCSRVILYMHILCPFINKLFLVPPWISSTAILNLEDVRNTNSQYRNTLIGDDDLPRVCYCVLCPVCSLLPAEYKAGQHRFNLSVWWQKDRAGLIQWSPWWWCCMCSYWTELFLSLSLSLSVSISLTHSHTRKHARILGIRRMGARQTLEWWTWPVCCDNTIWHTGPGMSRVILALFCHASSFV